MSQPLDDKHHAAIDETPGTVYRRRPRERHPVTDASDGIEALTGYDADALGGAGDRGWLDVVHLDDRSDFLEAVESAAVDEYLEETYRIETAEGEIRHLRDRFVLAAGEPATLEGVVFDVTETERRRRELRDDSEMLDAIFEHIPIHVFVKDRQARHVHRSDHLDFPENVIGKRDIDVDFIKEESARQAYEDDMRVIETGDTVLDQEEHYPAVGEWDLTSKVPLYDEDGDVMGLLGATRRITERKHAEQELRRKTERLENFADVVAHDIRNPLSEARRRAERIDDPEADAEHLDEAAEAIQRAGAVIDDVLALSRDGELPLDPEPVSLTEVVAEAWQTAAGDDDGLSKPDDDVEFRADRSHLARVFENLFRNGVGRDGATVTVETLDDGFAIEVDREGWIAEQREQSAAGRGSGEKPGLGLGLVEEIVEAHDWSIRLADDASDGERANAGGTRLEITGVDPTTPTDRTERSE